MITPVTSEDLWLQKLHGLSPLDDGAGPIVLISPHPDDETLGAGGFLSAQSDKGRSVTVIAVTNGEHAYSENSGLEKTRRQEQEQALHVLCKARAKLVRLCLVDSDVAASEAYLTEALTFFVSSDTHVIAPWFGDFHPDHEACGRAAESVARKANARLSHYLFWTWHRGTPATIEGLDLRSYALSDALQRTKLRALECHRSQLEHPSGEPILPHNLLAPARRAFEVFAE